MTTIHQTIELPSDRRLRLDLAIPEDIPAGKVEVTVTVLPVEKDAFKDTPYEKLRVFAGTFADSKTFDRDSVTIQREMRDEWD